MYPSKLNRYVSKFSVMLDSFENMEVRKFIGQKGAKQTQTVEEFFFILVNYTFTLEATFTIVISYPIKRTNVYMNVEKFNQYKTII